MDIHALATIIPLGLVAFVFFGLFWHHYARKKAFREFAEARGMTFCEHGLPSGTPDSLRDLPFMAVRSGGIGYSASGIFEGKRCALFDFTYKSGKHSYSVTMAWAEPAVALPRMELRPENFFDRLAAAVGWTDVNFDDDPDFSAAWHLKAVNADEVRRFLGPMARRRLLAETGWCIETQGKVIVVHKGSSRTAKAADFEDYLRAAGRIVSALSNR